MDQELFQIEADQLLAAEEIGFLLRHILEIGVVQAAGEAVPGLHDDVGQKVSLGAVGLEQPFPEEFHGLAWAVKRNDHQIGGDAFYRLYIVEFSGLVEEDLPFFENGEGVSGGDAHLAFVHEDKFPEIMAFSCEGEVAHIFKIMDAVDPLNGNGILQIHTVIRHKSASPGSCCLVWQERCFSVFLSLYKRRKKKAKEKCGLCKLRKI